MTGRLFVIGVGPGDPELLTLKAARIVRNVPVLFVPKGREEGASLALSILSGALPIDGKNVVELHFPMVKTKGHREACAGTREKDELDGKWAVAVDAVLQTLESGRDGAFITVGDPSIYSTFFYLVDRLQEKRPRLSIEIVPGISSINASACRAGVSLGLGNERIAVLPANYLERLEATLETFDTVVLMKVNKVFDAVRDILVRMNLENAAVYVARAGMTDERIVRDIQQVRNEDLNYFSLVIVRKR